MEDALAAAAAHLPITPELVPRRAAPSGTTVVDVEVSLHLVLQGAEQAEEQEERLYAQVVPLLDALTDSDSD
jgi:hypothetical protein